MIYNHITRHKIPSNASIAYYFLAPKEFKMDRLAGYFKGSIDFYGDLHQDEAGKSIFRNYWNLSAQELPLALKTFNRHFRLAPPFCEKVIVLVSHGMDDKLLWDGEELPFEQIVKQLVKCRIDVLLVLGCNTLKKYLKSKTRIHMPFKIVGFTDSVKFEESMFFASRFCNEYARNPNINVVLNEVRLATNEANLKWKSVLLITENQ